MLLLRLEEERTAGEERRTGVLRVAREGVDRRTADERRVVVEALLLAVGTPDRVLR